MMILLLLAFLPCVTSALVCGEVCTDFSHVQNDLGICSSKHSAQIWNTTSGECQVRMESELEIVSYMSMIFTAGVTPAVRYQIGKKCWHGVPEEVAKSIVSSDAAFDEYAACDSHPYNSPSLGWEMRYSMKTSGYKDCASLILMNNDYLASCVRLHADGRALATFGYLLGIAMFLLACLFCCSVCRQAS